MRRGYWSAREASTARRPAEVCGLPELSALFAAMRDECQKLGRKPESIDLTPGGMSLDADTIKRYEDLGVSRLVVGPPGFDPEAMKRGLGEFAERHIARSDS